MKACKKIVLAYSGGLDTTVAIPWLKEHTGAAIIALCVDVGQPDDLHAAVKKAVAAGAVEAHIVDAREQFVHECIAPAIKANALYEGVYPLLSALSRPVIAEQLVKAARACGADAVAHGCTGKGNDQVRFELALAALAPDLIVLAPARHWGFTRKDSVDYAKAHGMVYDAKHASPYSIDENLWGRAIECGDIEDAWLAPPSDAFAITKNPEDAATNPEMLELEFMAGVPTAMNGKPMELPDLIAETGCRAGACGVGRIDHVESRVVGMNSREVYDCPAARVLIEAHKALEARVLPREALSFKA
ncbi:MAG: argininosuccinate synthase, partial [Planctomycetota bacterium]